MFNKTTQSVLIALVIWDAVMYLTLGTSPVMGAILGGSATGNNNSNGSNFA